MISTGWIVLSANLYRGGPINCSFELAFVTCHAVDLHSADSSQLLEAAPGGIRDIARTIQSSQSGNDRAGQTFRLFGRRCSVANFGRLGSRSLAKHGINWLPRDHTESLQVTPDADLLTRTP
jgi:hypothetical protein